MMKMTMHLFTATMTMMMKTNKIIGMNSTGAFQLNILYFYVVFSAEGDGHTDKPPVKIGFHTIWHIRPSTVGILHGCFLMLWNIIQ